MVEEYKGRIISHKKMVMRTDYSKYIPSSLKQRFIPITLKPIIPLYPDSLRGLREEAKRKKRFERTMKEPGLEKKLELVIAFGSVLISMLYFSTNFTGFAIGNLNQTDINIVGAIFFVLGILIGLMGLRKR